MIRVQLSVQDAEGATTIVREMPQVPSAGDAVMHEGRLYYVFQVMWFTDEGQLPYVGLRPNL